MLDLVLEGDSPRKLVIFPTLSESRSLYGRSTLQPMMTQVELVFLEYRRGKCVRTKGTRAPAREASNWLKIGTVSIYE